MDETVQKQPDWVKESEQEETVGQDIHIVQRSLKFRSRRCGSNLQLKIERHQTFQKRISGDMVSEETKGKNLKALH